MKTFLIHRFAVASLCLSIVSGQGIDLDFIDPAGTGFNDNTPIPVSERPAGNSGATLGEQRRNVLIAAADRWADFLDIRGPILIEANFEVATCSRFSGVLAFAGPRSFSRGFSGAPDPNLLYVAPLVNHLTGEDRFPDAAEIGVTVNSAIDDDPNCLGGRGFYYGLDGQSGLQTDLFAVLLHELGHGLGFLTLSDGTTGQLPGNRADSYTAQMFDLGQRRAWTEMTPSQRLESSVNDPLLVWNGEGTNAVAKNWLTGRADRVNSLTIEGQPNNQLALTGNFGPLTPLAGLSGELEFVDDGVAPVTDACESLAAGSLAGKIAVVDRGTCTFAAKVRNAEQAGAIAVIVVNNNPDELFLMGADELQNPSIPSYFVHLSTRELLADGLEVELSRDDPDGMALGRLRLHAPRPFESGSSNSHWTTEASPNLLMEPSLGFLERDDPGITLTAMREIGWTVNDIPFPNLTYNIWAERELASVPVNQAVRTADPDNDGLSNFAEYAQGTDPLTDDGARSPFDLRILNTPRELRYTRNAEAADLSFVVRESLDLEGFDAPQTTQPWQIVPIGDREEVRRLYTFPTDERFYRVEVLED